MSLGENLSGNLMVNSSPLNANFDPSALLESLQHQSTLTFIPAMVFLSLLSVVGVIRNSLVLYVYWKKFRWTPLGVLIMEMSVYDLLTNTIVIPGEIYDMFHQWDFDIPDLCRARRFMNVATTLASGLSLVSIGVTRYKRICQPLRKQVTTTQVYIGSIFIVVVSVACSLPFSLLNGRRTRDTGTSRVKGSSCDVDDAYAGTVWPLVNSAFFFLVYMVSAALIVTLYWMIWSKARRHRSSMSKSMSRSISDSNLLLRKQPEEDAPSAARANLRRLKRMSRSLQALGREAEQSEEASSTDPVVRLDLSASCVSVHVDLASDALQQNDCNRHIREPDTARKDRVVWLNLLSSIGRRFSHSTYRKEAKPLEIPSPKFRKKQSSPSNASSRGSESFHKTCSTISYKSSTAESRDFNSMNVSLEMKQINLTTRRFLVRPTSCRRRYSERRPRKNHRRHDFGRTSCMLFTISVVFLLSYLPFTLLQAFKNALLDRNTTLEGPGLALFQLFYRSYLWNSASNPIIYSLCDLRFRQETMKIFNIS